MKKVGIITLNGYKNYGNRLQNYALQEAVKSLGFSVDTIIIEAIEDKHTKKKLNINKVFSLLKIIKKSKEKINKIINNKKYSNYIEERVNNFKKFTIDNILETDFTISDVNIPTSKIEKYDYFITGSDQVWNPHYINGSSTYFLTFAPKNKRLSYAPSFGTSIIPEEYVNKYKIWLSEIESLSVREVSGAKIIKDLTGLNAKVVVDPTMLLSKEKWLSVSKPSEFKPKNPYLLTYFLGEIPKESKQKIKSIAIKNNLEIVNLASLNDLSHYTSGPSEFIDYINSAELFCTDSFHGVVFSILLEKPFIVFNRVDSLPSMNSRIDTLLSTFNLESRMDNKINMNDVLSIDYTHIPEILDREKKRAINYLMNALKII